MSKCCKCAKWWPHNWLCLKHLYYVFIILNTITPILLGMIMSLTLAKIIKVLRKIKHAVAPCACAAQPEVTAEAVVEKESK